MSAAKEASKESDQKQLETRGGDGPGPVEPDNKAEQGNDFPKMSQTAKSATSPMTLIKEEVKKMFKDKDSDPKPSQSAEKINSPLTFLKEDLNSLKEGLSNIFRVGPSRDREKKNVAEKEASRNEPRTQSSTAERADEAFMTLFRREKPLPKTAQTNHVEEAKTTKALEINSTEQNQEKTEKSENAANGLKKSEVSQLTGSGPEKKTQKSSAPTRESEKMFASKIATASEKRETKHWLDGSVSEEEDDKPLGKALSSEISLFLPRTDPSCRSTEDLWSLKNSAIYLTFDPNTANSELRLADDNRKATRDWLSHRWAEHPERFEQCPQLLCREGLLDSAYWEVLWSGGADIGVTYNNICRDGDAVSCLLGFNEQSWTLECSDGVYTACHNNRRFQASSPQPFTNRVGVYLNCPAGRLSFFCVSQDSMVHLHTFTCTFTEPLYPGFWVWARDGSVSLCQVEMDWERLLQ
ncbi:uncharacterized protein V3H82_009305 [Fundulus diaphanus]